MSYDMVCSGVVWCHTTAVLVVQAILRPGDVAADIGAHIGTQTVPMAWSVQPSGVVHAFEVLRASYDLLVTNIGLSRLGNVITHHSALGLVADRPNRTMWAQRVVGRGEMRKSLSLSFPCVCGWGGGVGLERLQKPEIEISSGLMGV